MDEERKINELLERYSQFFETTPADVARSVKGRYFFYLVDDRSGDLFSFTEFETADELERIIIEEMADSLNTALEAGIENLNVALNEREISYLNCNYGKAVSRLAGSLESISMESQKWFDMVRNSLESLTAFAESSRKIND